MNPEVVSKSFLGFWEILSFCAMLKYVFEYVFVYVDDFLKSQELFLGLALWGLCFLVSNMGSSSIILCTSLSESRMTGGKNRRRVLF